MTDFEMYISAVIPTFNAEKFIKTTLESLLDQSFPLHEIIVVDDGSSDSTCTLVKNVGKTTNIPLHLIKQQSNKGVSTARNTGVQKAVGNWILFMDADDEAEPSLITQEVQRLQQMQQKFEDNWVLVYTAYQQMDESGNFITKMESKQVKPKEIFGHELVRNEISTSGVLLRKAFFLEAGGFDSGIKYSEDWDLWLRMAQRGGFVYVAEPLIRVRRHPGNTSKQLKTSKEAESVILRKYPLSTIKHAIFKRELSFEKNTVDYVSVLFRLNQWEKGAKELKKTLQKIESSGLLFFLGLYYLHLQRFSQARASFAKVLEYSPLHGATLNNLGALYMVDGNFFEARQYLEHALRAFPGYIDASHNLRLIELHKKVKFEDLKFTWRELRKNLLRYTNGK